MTPERLTGRLATVVAIPVVPFDTDGAVDVETYGRLLDRIVDGGVETVTCNGNTGEFYALSTAEVNRVVEATAHRIGGRATMLAGVGHDVDTAVTAARWAQRAGVVGIMIHQPVHPYVAADGWVDYHKAIADAVPDLGIVLYVRNPAIRGEQIARLADLCPNVVGVKYAVPDPVRFATVASEAGHADRLTWIAGGAELTAPGYFAVGATGFTSGLVNVSPELSMHMLSALRAADYPSAMKVWELVRPFEEMRTADASAHNVSVVKEALAILGQCRRDVRPPAHTLDEAKRTRVAEILASWGLEVR